jgi:hypothetical protein
MDTPSARVEAAWCSASTSCSAAELQLCLLHLLRNEGQLTVVATFYYEDYLVLSETAYILKRNSSHEMEQAILCSSSNIK